eukprot:9290510-Pyramimonas_sp.AAC.1
MQPPHPFPRPWSSLSPSSLFSTMSYVSLSAIVAYPPCRACPQSDGLSRGLCNGMADDEGVATMATLANATTLAMGNGCHDDDVGDAGVGG